MKPLADTWIGNVPMLFKAIAVNLGHTNSKVFDSVWRRECSDCDGTGEVSYRGLPQDAPHRTTPGLPVPCRQCNGTGDLEPYDLMITFVRRKDKLWNVSLYSTKPDVDCRAIARSFSGDGDKEFGEFVRDELPFEY